MTGKIDTILDILSDAEWHHFDEIMAAEEVDCNEEKLGHILSFLSHFDFITYDHQDQKARVSPAMAAWWKSITEEDEQHA